MRYATCERHSRILVYASGDSCSLKLVQVLVRGERIVFAHMYVLIVLVGLTLCANAGIERCCCFGCGDLDDHSRNHMTHRCLNGSIGVVTGGTL